MKQKDEWIGVVRGIRPIRVEKTIPPVKTPQSGVTTGGRYHC